MAGYKVYRDGSLISASLLTAAFFEDAGWTAGGHVYEVSAVDSAGFEGRRARATAPPASLALPAVTLTRGFFDTLSPTVRNSSSSAMNVGPAAMTLTDSFGVLAASATAAAVSVGSGQLGALPGVIATPVSLTTTSALHVTVGLPTDAGASVYLAGDFSLAAADPQAPLVEALPDVLAPGTNSPVRVRLYNRGSAPMDVATAQVQNSTFTAVNNVQVQLLSAQGALLASAGLLQAGNGANGIFVNGQQLSAVTIPPGSSFIFDPVNVLVPNTAAATLNVVALVSTPTYNLAGAALPGIRGFASAAALGTVQQISYKVSAAPDRTFYDQGSSVTITGQATDAVSGAPVPNAGVAVDVLSNGFDRQVTAVTNSSGSYSAGFFPLPNEAGLYAISAAAPGVVTKAPQSTFTIVGFGFQYSNYSATLAQGSSYAFTVGLTNTGASAIAGLTASSATLSGSGLTLTLDTTTLPSSLAAGGQASLSLNASAAASSSSGTVTLSVAESHGFARTLPIGVTVAPAQAIPVVTPSQFLIGMLGGDVRTVALAIQNKGFDTWRGVTVTTPALSWAVIQGTTTLGDIPPGANANVTLQFSPPFSLANQTYAPSPLLQLLSTNVAPVGVQGAVAITSARKGDVAVNVINADKPRNGQGQGVGIAGATVTLTSLDVAGLNYTAAADANGLGTILQVPSGNYAWNVSALGFQTVSGTAMIEPGLTNQIQAILPTALVSYQWSVTPTTIQDQYDIVLSLTYRTDVPAPVILVQPPMINLAMSGGQTLNTQITVTNKGLVSAFNYGLSWSGDPAIQITLPYTTIPEIKAGQSIAIPVQLTLSHASCHAAAIISTYSYPCAAGNQESGSAPNVNIAAGDGCGSPGAAANNSSSGGGGGGGNWGGVGGGAFVSLVAPGANTAPTCALPNRPPPGWGHPPRMCPLKGGHGADPTDGSTRPRTNAPIGFPADAPSGLAPFYDPAYNSLNPNPASPGGGWALPTIVVQAANPVSVDPNTPLTVTETDGSQRTLVPLAPLNQSANGNGPQFALPVHEYLAWAYDLNKNAFTMQETNGTITKFQAVNPSSATLYLPTSVTDRNGNTLAYAYDSSGNVTSQTDNHGRSLNYSYNAQGQLASISDSAQRSTAYGYDAAGNRTSETDVNGDVTHYAYDSGHRMTQITYPNGGRTSFTYDGQGRVSVESDDGGNNQSTYAYFQSSTTETDALSRVTEYDWISVQGLRKVARIVDPRGGVTTLAYDGNMNLTGRTDPLGRTTRYTYDGNGNMISATDPSGQTSQAGYDPKFSQATSATDPNGNKMQMFYDASGDLIQTMDALGNSTMMSPDKQGHMTGVKDALGNVTSFGYNGNGAVTSVSDPLGRTTGITRDSLSRVTANTDPMGKQTTFSYDSTMGDVTQVKDALNNTTAFGYQAGRRGRLLNSVTDAKGHATGIGYDAVGRLTGVTNALNQAKSFGYDAKGNLVSATDANGKNFSFAYDNLDRLTTKTLPEGNVTFGYDAAGNLTSANSYNGSGVTMSYDALNRVTQVVQTLPGGFSATIGYSYDANGNRTKMTTPWGSFNYTYDAMNRLTKIVNPQGKVITFAYDALGRRTKLDYPNGIETTYAYDAAGELTQILHRRLSDNTAVAFANYTYNGAGDRTSMQDPAGTHTYGYDSLHRLTSASHPAGSYVAIKNEAFSYDAVGNRTADVRFSSYTYDAANRMTSNSSFTYTYDANGNELTAGATNFVYYSENQLKEVDLPNGTRSSYKYDAFNRKVEKSTGSTTSPIVTRFIFDGPNILAMLDGNNNFIAAFTSGVGVDEPLIMHRADNTDYFLHADGLSSVATHTDVNGTVIERVEYETYGKPVFVDVRGSPIVSTASFTNSPFAYTGRLWESETGLYEHRNRQTYEPLTGRFGQADPIDILGGINLYLYAGSNPQNVTDFSGLSPTTPDPLDEEILKRVAERVSDPTFLEWVKKSLPLLGGPGAVEKMILNSVLKLSAPAPLLSSTCGTAPAATAIITLGTFAISFEFTDVIYNQMIHNRPPLIPSLGDWRSRKTNQFQTTHTK